MSYELRERKAIETGQEAHVEFLLENAWVRESSTDSDNSGCCSDPRVVLTPGETVCTHCGYTEQLMTHTQEAVEFNDRHETPYVYKRAVHFTDWLMRANGMEITLIPHSVMRAVKHRLDGQATSIANIRSALRDTGNTKYYENAQQIYAHMNGVQVAPIPPKVMDQLKSMFAEMQGPYEHAKRALYPARKNFLSYSYILHKMCQLLGKDEFLPRFPLLRSRDKLKEAEAIWKSMCDQLRWEFIPA